MALGAGIKAGEAYVEMALRDGKMRSGLAKGRRTLQQWGRGLGGILGVGLSTAGLIAGIKTATSAATRQLQAERKLSAVLSATGGAAGFSARQLKRYAAELQKATNYGDETIINAQAILATFKQIKGDVFKDATEAALDLSTTLDQDLKSSIIQLGKALNDPLRGMTALQRVGISFSETQKKTVESLLAAGNVTGAQRLILGEIQGQVGGAARAAADPTTQLKNTLGDLAEAIGRGILPVIWLWSKSLDTSAQLATGSMGRVGDIFLALADTVDIVAAAFGTLQLALLYFANFLQKLIIRFRQMLGLGDAQSLQAQFDSLTDSFADFAKRWDEARGDKWSSEQAKALWADYQRQREKARQLLDNLAGAGSAAASAGRAAPSALLAGSAELAAARADQTARDQLDELSQLNKTADDINKKLDDPAAAVDIPR